MYKDEKQGGNYMAHGFGEVSKHVIQLPAD
jgi:hypothetical protein